MNVTASYTGQINNLQLPAPFDVNNVAYFQQYLSRSTTVNSINVNVENGSVSDTTTGIDYSYNLSAANPTTIVGGNGVNLTGNFTNQGSQSADALVFGTLSGTANLQSAATVTPGPQGSGGSWFSPYGLTYNVTATETTKLDHTGLVTPTIAVSNGINLNGSKVTNVGAATVATDAVNLGQLNEKTQFVAFAGGVGAAQALGLTSLAIGGDGSDGDTQGAQAFSTDAVAIGRDAVALGSETTALGSGARAGLSGALAFGKGANAGGSLAVAIGPNVQALGDDSIGIGAGATPVGNRATAIGRSANALANGTAIGAGANAAHTGATAIGQNAVTTRADQIVLGTASNSISLPGLITTSDAAQSGQEFFVTVDNNGTLGKGAQSSAAISQIGSQVSALQQGQAVIDDQVAALQQGQANLFDLRNLDRKQNRRGIAAAAATAHAPFPPEPGQTGYAANTAVYRGQAAFSVAITHRLKGAKSFAITGGVAHSGGKDTVVKAGVAGVF